MFLEKLNSATSKIKSLEEKLQDINLIKNQKKYSKIIKEYTHLEKINTKKIEYEKILSQINDNKTILEKEDQQEMKELIKQELIDLDKKRKILNIK